MAQQAHARLKGPDIMGVVRLLPDVLFRCYKGDDGKIYWSLNEGGLAEEFDLTTEEIEGKSLEELFPGGASEPVREHFEAAFQGSTEPFTNEMGGRHFRHFPQPVYDDAGHVIEVVGFISEVTELVQAQHALEQANRDLEAFAASVSHDLRSPLSVISNLAQVLQMRNSGRLDDESVGHLDRIKNTTQTMGRTIDDMLALAHASSGLVAPEDVDLTPVANNIIEVLILMEPDHPVRWEVQKGMQARMDPKHARLLVQNLLGNAAKYTKGTKEPVVHFYTETQDAATWYVLEDNGVGFVQAESDKIFEPFERLHGGEFKGSGIGLATVQRILERHGGIVEAHSDGPGQGARFRFCLDPAPEDPGAA